MSVCMNCGRPSSQAMFCSAECSQSYDKEREGRRVFKALNDAKSKHRDEREHDRLFAAKMFEINNNAGRDKEAAHWLKRMKDLGEPEPVVHEYEALF
jgi:hypothetical protein